MGWGRGRGEAGLEQGVKMFCKMAHFQRGSSGCSQAQPLDTASVGSLPWAAGHLSATCSALSLGSNVPGQLCTCSEGHTWLLLHRSVPNHTWPGWAGPPGSGYDLLGTPALWGLCWQSHTQDLSKLLSFLLSSVTTNAVFSWFPTINCDARLLWNLPAKGGPWGWAVHGAGLSLGLGCPWGWPVHGVPRGAWVWLGCGVAGLWGRRAVVLGRP